MLRGHERQPGVYHYRWGTDDVRVIVAGQLSREPHNAALHLFSASPELVGFGQSSYHQRSESTSLLLGQLFRRFRREISTMSYTMEDFKRDMFREYFTELPPEERRELLESLPLEKRLAGLSRKQILQYLDKPKGGRPTPRKPRRRN